MYCMSVACKALFQSLGSQESIGSISSCFHEAKNLVEQVDQPRQSQRRKMGKGRKRRRGKKDKGRIVFITITHGSSNQKAKMQTPELCSFVFALNKYILSKIFSSYIFQNCLLFGFGLILTILKYTLISLSSNSNNIHF